MYLPVARKLAGDGGAIDVTVSLIDLVVFDLKTCCLIILIHLCYHVLARRIRMLTTLILTDPDIQLEAFDCGSVESLVPVTQLSLLNKYNFV